MFLVTLRQSTQ